MKIEQKFSPQLHKEISIEVGGMSYLIIYGRHVNGWYLCMPGWNVSCELGNPADCLAWNLDSLTGAFHKVGYEPEWAKKLAVEILNTIYDFENGKKQCS